MKISELSKLTSHIDMKNLSANDMKNLISKAGIDWNDFFGKLEMESPYAQIWKGEDMLSEHIALHCHDFYEIIFCMEGSVKYLLGIELHMVQPGDLVVIPPDIGHRPVPTKIPGQSYSRYGIWITHSFVQILKQLEPEARFPVQKPLVLHPTGLMAKSFLQHMKSAYQVSRQKPYFWQGTFLGEIMLLITEICQSFTLLENKKSDINIPERLSHILSYLETHLSDKITLEGVAEQFFVSKNTISQLFRKHMDDSFYHYVIKRRLIAARKYMIEGDAIETAAYKAGFPTYSNFYRAFQKEYGVAPIMYIEDYKKTH